MNKIDYIDYVSQRSKEFVRKQMISAFSTALPYYVLTEFPKSGGTWLASLIASVLEIPFPRQQLPRLRPSVIHGHYLPTPRLKNAIVLLRDGRDIMVSWYFHCTTKYAEGNSALVDVVARDLKLSDPLDVSLNLPRFIEYSFERQRHPRFSWTQFVRAWEVESASSITVRYEDLRVRTAEELTRVVSSLTGIAPDPARVVEVVEAHRFEKMSNRQAGQEDRSSFLRKGISGDWVNYFTPEARSVFEHYAGLELIRLNYEKDSTWLKN